MNTTNDAPERLSPAAGSVSDTPRTDEMDIKIVATTIDCVDEKHFVSANFARELERERNAIFAALLKARMLLAHINMFISHDDPLYADVVAYFASDSQNDQTQQLGGGK